MGIKHKVVSNQKVKLCLFVYLIYVNFFTFSKTFLGEKGKKDETMKENKKHTPWLGKMLLHINLFPCMVVDNQAKRWLKVVSPRNKCFIIPKGEVRHPGNFQLGPISSGKKLNQNVPASP